MNSRFICETLGELFDEPCNFSPCEENLHEEENNIRWCEKHCGKATAAECWMHYFKIIKNKKEH